MYTVQVYCNNVLVIICRPLASLSSFFFMKFEILEEHDQVLAFWHQVFKEHGQLSVLHIDSHSDLAIKEPHEEIEIGNFVIEAFKFGWVKEFIWLKPEQSLEIQTGKEEFECGFLGDSEVVKCTSSLPIFASDKCDENFLLDNFPVHLQVVDNAEQIDLTGKSNIVIDIDLDYFCCLNPSKEAFAKKHGLERFQELKEKVLSIKTSKDVFEFERQMLSQDPELAKSFLVDEIGYPSFIFPEFDSDEQDWDEKMKQIVKCDLNLDKAKLCTVTKSVSSGYTPKDKAESILRVVSFYISNLENLLARNLL